MGTTPENTRQITLFVPENTLKMVDESAYQIRQRKNDRTVWILDAIEKKLAREKAITDGQGEPDDEKRIKEIVNAYNIMNDDGKEWLYTAVCVARGADDFKQ